MAHPEIESRYPQEWPVHVRLLLTDGTTLEESIKYPKGDPENQLSSTEMREKFRMLAAYGGHAETTDAWLGWIDSLEGAKQIVIRSS